MICGKVGRLDRKKVVVVVVVAAAAAVAGKGGVSAAAEAVTARAVFLIRICLHLFSHVFFR